MAGESVETALAVPPGAVVRDGTRAFVFVQQEGGIFERRPVETGTEDDRRVVIARGLSAGETVAVAGTAALWTAHASVR